MVDIQINASLKYERLKGILNEALRNGEYKPGDKLPSQNEMADKYGVSPGTVREALASLVNDGLLYRVQGKGTFVSDGKQEPPTIALVIPHLHLDGDTEFSMGFNMVAPLIRYIEDEIRKSNAELLLYLDNDDIEQERENLRKVINRNVDAVIIYFIGYGQNEDYIKVLSESGVPVVMIDRYVDGINTCYVGTDNYSGSRQMTELLIDNGFNEIFYVSNSSDCSAIADRISGYETAMASNGLGCNVLTRWEPSPTNMGEEDEAYRVTSDMLREVSGPVGIFAANSLMIAGVWQAVVENRDDISSVALAFFDDEYVRFPEDLFVVKALQPIEQISRHAVQLALSGYNSKKSLHLMPEIRVLSSKNVESCA